MEALVPSVMAVLPAAAEAVWAAAVEEVRTAAWVHTLVADHTVVVHTLVEVTSEDGDN